MEAEDGFGADMSRQLERFLNDQIFKSCQVLCSFGMRYYFANSASQPKEGARDSSGGSSYKRRKSNVDESSDQNGSP